MPEKLINEEMKEQISKLAAPNIAVIGRTGVGKSTLINSVFGVDLAQTGAGLPVTQGFCRYPEEGNNNGIPIVIYDSAGYEAGQEQEFVERVLGFLSQKKDEGIDQQIHLVWYIINASSARVENFEKTIIDNINHQGIPAILVLSQCDRAKPEEIEGIEAALKNFNLKKVYDVIQVAASPLVIRGKQICAPFGLPELVDKTVELLPEIYTDAVIAMQVVNLQAKRKTVWKYISVAATTCFTAGASPVPAGTATLVATQTGLCIAIASVYGYKELGEFLVSIGTIATLNTILSSALGELIGIFFPPASLAAGAGMASYVVVFGLACTAVFEKMVAENLHGKGREEIEKYLRDSFRQEFEKYSLLRINSLEALEIVKKNFLNPS